MARDDIWRIKPIIRVTWPEPVIDYPPVPKELEPALRGHPEPAVDWKKVPIIGRMWRRRPLAAQSLSLADRAGALAAERRSYESNLLYRIAFSRGENDPRISAAIDRITEKAIGAVDRIELRSHTCPNGSPVTSTIGYTVSARAFLETALGSRLTLMDAVDLLDIASPLFRVKEIHLNHYMSEDGLPRLSINGIYERNEGSSTPLACSVELEFHDGKPVITRRNLSVSCGFRRMAIGTRRLLRTVQFAQLHGIGNWEDDISEDGLFVWPRLGAPMTSESLEYVLGKLKKLVENGVVGHIDLSANGPYEIASFILKEKDVLDTNALKKWYRHNTRIRPHDIDTLSPPYRVGLAALRGSVIYADFVPKKIEAELLIRHIPRRLESGLIHGEARSRLDEDQKIRLTEAADGLATDFSSALVREWVVKSVEESANEDAGASIEADGSGLWMPGNEFAQNFDGVVEPALLSAATLLKM